MSQPVEPVPCFHCGSAPEVKKHRCTRRWYARCWNLDCQEAPAGRSADDRDAAVRNWNEDMAEKKDRPNP